MEGIENCSNLRTCLLDSLQSMILERTEFFHLEYIKEQRDLLIHLKA